MTIPAIPALPNPPSEPSALWYSRLADLVNRLIQRANCVVSLTLTANAASTTMTDARLTAFSVLTFLPTTASAATAHGTIYVTAQKNGQATINHANTADVDKAFTVAIHG